MELANSEDQIYDEQNSIWSAALEQTGVILVICAPTFSKLWNHFRGKTENVEEQSSNKRTPSPMFSLKNTWIELGNAVQSQTSISDTRQRDEELGEVSEISYHSIKRSESVNKPMKAHVRNEATNKTINGPHCSTFPHLSTKPRDK